MVEFDDSKELIHYGVKGMRWGHRREDRLQRLERVAGGTASRGDKLKTSFADTAAGAKRSKQIDAQIRAGKQLKEATASGEKVTKAVLKYYGTRTVPGLATHTFNRGPKAEKAPKIPWTPGKEARLQRLERVAGGTASRGDKLKTGFNDIAGFASKERQVGAQIRAAQQLKTSRETGTASAKAVLNYYGTRTIPGIASQTFNRN